MIKKILYLILIVPFFSSAQFWTDKATTFANASRGVNCISIVDENTVWVKAFDGAVTTNTTVQEYARSTDGGNTWTSGIMNLGLGGSPSLGVGNISAVSSTTAYISLYPTGNTNGGIWKTVDGGTTWTKQTSASFNTSGESFANIVHFFDVNNGVALGDPAGGYFEIYTTSNAGVTWTRVPSANIPVPLGGAEYGVTNVFETVGNTIWFGTDKGRLFKSSNSGLNWTVASTPIADFTSATAGGSFTFKDVNNGLLLTDGGSLFKTSDGGLTWVSQSFSGPIYTGDLTYVPGTSKVICTGAASGASGSAYSLDDGLNWINIDTNQHLQVEFLNEMTGFTGGFNQSSTLGGIAKYTGTTLTNETFEVEDFSLYPNPINDSFIIQNKNNTTILGLMISDINGKIVKNINVNSIGNEINISDLNSGIYFLNIDTENGTATKKIIKK